MVARQAEILFSAYRAADYADPRGFAVQLGSILSEFSEEVVIYVTSPRTGIQRRSKWPPTISEVLAACEEHQDFLKRLRAEKPRPTIAIQYRPPGHLANVFVSPAHPRYASLVTWAESAEPQMWRYGKSSTGEDGLWVSSHILENGVRQSAFDKNAQVIEAELEISTEGPIT